VYNVHERGATVNRPASRSGALLSGKPGATPSVRDGSAPVCFNPSADLPQPISAEVVEQ